MSMEVAKHGVASPSTDDANLVGVFATKEEGHGTTVAEGAGGDVVDGNASVSRDELGGSAEESGDHGG